jgi:hypothetical protein
MLRPWVVRAGDGRLATTRRPFRFGNREDLLLSTSNDLARGLASLRLNFTQ